MKFLLPFFVLILCSICAVCLDKVTGEQATGTIFFIAGMTFMEIGYSVGGKCEKREDN